MHELALEFEKVDTKNFGVSVYAHVDMATLEVLDRRSDEECVPRSWLIARILQDWSAQHRIEEEEPPQQQPARRDLAA